MKQKDVFTLILIIVGGYILLEYLKKNSSNIYSNNITEKINSWLPYMPENWQGNPLQLVDIYDPAIYPQL